MIIESLIKDESKVTFDCAKATIQRGSRIDIEDKYYAEKEIQNAIKLNLCVLVGPPPVLPEAAPKAEKPKTIRFRNNFDSKLCFECIKDYADPGMLVHIPVTMLDEPEVRNAIAAGWLLNEDNPELNPVIYAGAPMQLEELTANDVIDVETADLVRSLPAAKPQPLPEGVPATRPKPKQAQSQIKAKRISTGGDGDDDNESSSSDLYKESKVIVPKANSSRRGPKAAPMMVEDTDKPEETVEGETNPDADFDFSNVFSARQPKKK